MSDTDIALQARAISKKFSRSLGRSILYGAQDVCRNLVGLGTRSERLRREEFWAVEDVSFELRRGEIMGLIGSNGSGKSTTLKMLNGIFMPDVGEIEVRGKVGALIDVGVGFHPMLTGRENIYVSGAVHGMPREKIDRLLDEIIGFSEVEAFIDTPVKYYSSGMFVRLGFSVAIHLDPDVLLIDEVLSVGDLAFGRKCFKKIEAVLNSGVTVVFVSHAIRHVERICQKAVLLNRGRVAAFGDAREVTARYYEISNRMSSTEIHQPSQIQMIGEHSDPERFEVTGIELLDSEGFARSQFSMLDRVIIRVHFCAHEKISGLLPVLRFVTIDGISVSSFSPSESNRPDWEGPATLDCVVLELPLREGVYLVTLSFSDQTSSLFKCERAAELSVVPDRVAYHTTLSTGSLVYIPTEWQIREAKAENLEGGDQ